MKLGVTAWGGPRDGSHFKPLFDETKELSSWKDIEADMCLLLWGGEDISPYLYGQKANSFCESGNIPTSRDQIEWSMVKRAVELDCPIIGICRGAQLLCAYDGGFLAQDVSNHKEGHRIATESGEIFDVPAHHHQMMVPLEHNLVVAWAHPTRTHLYVGENDAINYFPEDWKEPEIVFFPKLKAIGFQGHPEWAQWMSPFVKYSQKIVKNFILSKVEV